MIDVKYERPENIPFYLLERDICEALIKNEKFAPDEIRGSIETELTNARKAIQKAREIIETWDMV